MTAPKYLLALDVAKHKSRAALCDGHGRFAFEQTLSADAPGRRTLLERIAQHLPPGERLLVLIEATGTLHLHWAAALARAGYSVLVINPLMARRLCTPKNSIRDNKTDPIDARQLCRVGLLHHAELEEKYRFALQPDQLALQRLHTVRKALRASLTNLKKTYGSLLELSFPELEQLMETDGQGLRALLAKAPTPAAIARKPLRSLEADWRLRPKAAQLRALAANSIADPQIAAANAPALQAILQSLTQIE